MASLQPGTIDIWVAYGYGANDGGGVRRLQVREVPPDCRMPNTYVWVILKGVEVAGLEKMTAEEARTHRWE